MSLPSSTVFRASVLALIMIITLIPFATAYTWTSDTRIVSDLAMDTYPTSIQTENDKIWVFWQSNRILYQNLPQHEIFYKILSPSGTWSSDTRLTYDKNEDLTPGAMEAYDGKIWVVWASSRPIPPSTKAGNKEIFYKTTSDGGVSWSSDTQLTNDTNEDGRPNIFQAQDLKIWVVWHSNRTGNNELYYKTSSDDGATWTNDTQLTNQIHQDSSPSITQARNGTIWVVWQSNRTGNYEIYYKTSSDNGATWIDDRQLSNHVRFDTNPSVIEAKDRTIWVVWQSNRILNVEIPQNDIFLNVYDGTSWLGNDYYERLTLDMKGDMSPAIMQGHTSIWVVWASDRSDGYDIYYKTTSMEVHDVGVYRIVSTAPPLNKQTNRTYQRILVNVTVQVKNWGSASETFDVTAYYNGTSLGTQTVSALNPGHFKKVEFLWHTENDSPGHYLLSATATQVPSETYTIDNTLSDVPIQLKIPGDINSNNVVNIFDAILLVINYGLSYYDFPECDINGDRFINVLDAILIMTHWGETLP